MSCFSYKEQNLCQGINLLIYLAPICMDAGSILCSVSVLSFFPKCSK